MPHSVHMKKNNREKRYLNDSHLEKYEWLVYSGSKKGLYFKYCTLFSYHLTVVYNAKKSGQDHNFKKKADTSFKSSPTPTILTFLN